MIDLRREPVYIVEYTSFDVTVLPAEVDTFHVVHFSNYLRWFSGGVAKFFSHLGVGPHRFDDDRVELRVGKVSISYVSSAFMGDVVSISTTSAALHENSILFSCQASVESRILSRAKIKIAFVDAISGKITPSPNDVVKVFIDRTAKQH